MNKIYKKRAAGVAVVEFAIVLPLLVLMLYGITEIGRAIYQQNTLYKGLMAGSRYLGRAGGYVSLDTSTTPPTCTKASNASDYEDAAKELIASTVVDFFPGFTTNHIAIEHAGNDISYIAEVLEDVVACKIRITADAPFNALFVPVDAPGFASFNIHAEIEERYIGL